jgi:hypothetical protein
MSKPLDASLQVKSHTGTRDGRPVILFWRFYLVTRFGTFVSGPYVSLQFATKAAKLWATKFNMTLSSSDVGTVRGSEALIP